MTSGALRVTAILAGPVLGLFVLDAVIRLFT
jgi:hypothetical protein